VCCCRTGIGFNVNLPGVDEMLRSSLTEGGEERRDSAFQSTPGKIHRESYSGPKQHTTALEQDWVLKAPGSGPSMSSGAPLGNGPRTNSLQGRSERCGKGSSLRWYLTRIRDNPWQ